MSEQLTSYAAAALAQLVEESKQPPRFPELLEREPQLGIDNPMWDLVRPHVNKVDSLLGVGFSLEVGGYGATLHRALRGEQVDPQELMAGDWLFRRDVLVSRYAWSITDPWAVTFVAKWAGGRLIDPLAGTGYWAYLLGQLGCDVFASDLHPPHPDKQDNVFHVGVQYVPVIEMDALKAVTEHGRGRTLLLAWPPWASDLGTHIVQNYPGDRIVFIGELGGTCGDESLIVELATHWNELDYEIPVQFSHLHDRITVFERTDTNDHADRKKDDEEPGST